MMEPSENQAGYAVSFTLIIDNWYLPFLFTLTVMMLPPQQYVRVQDSTVTARAKNFHSVQYLLVHGTADGESHSQSFL